MTAKPDWLRAAIERRNTPTNTDEEEETTTPPSFDGGARTTMPAPKPSMNVLIRRARFGGDLAGQHTNPDDTAA